VTQESQAAHASLRDPPSFMMEASPSSSRGISWEEASAASEATSTGTTPTVLKPLPRTHVPEFLEPYGYLASTALDWRGTPPELNIQVSGHSSSGGHTFYHMECTLAQVSQRRSLSSGGTGERSTAEQIGQSLVWQSQRRLADLRAGLHDPVRKALGSSYGTYFCGVHFAHRLRPSGTTSRLDAWFRRLAYCINSKLVSPAIAAEALRLLDIPAVSEDSAIVSVAGESPRVERQPSVSATPTTLQSQSAAFATAAAIAAAAKAPMAPPAGVDFAGDAASTCTGGASSARGMEGEESPALVVCEEEASDAVFSLRSGAVCSGEGMHDEVETSDDEDLTEEVLANGLPGLD